MTTEPRKHLFIATPCYGSQVFSQYAMSLLKLQTACLARGIGFTVVLLGGDALITRARQTCVTRFLENKEATHLLFIDADIGFEPEQVFRLLDSPFDMSAAVYPTKRVDWQKVEAIAAGRLKLSGNLESASLNYVFEFVDPAKIGVRDGFAQVRYAGTGFLMIRRQVLLDMIAHYPELKYTREHQMDDPLRDSPWRSALFNCVIDEKTGAYLSEDFSFCKRWNDMGGEIWADLQSRLTHTGSVTFIGDTATQFGQASG